MFEGIVCFGGKEKKEERQNCELDVIVEVVKKSLMFMKIAGEEGICMTLSSYERAM